LRFKNSVKGEESDCSGHRHDLVAVLMLRHVLWRLTEPTIIANCIRQTKAEWQTYRLTNL